MYLNENLDHLAVKFPELNSNIRNITHQLVRSDIDTEPSKSGLPTVYVSQENDKQYLHSRYNPQHEASQWIQDYADKIDDYDHVLFYGIGLGYHVEHFQSMFPQKEFTLYEPNVYVFYQYLVHGRLHLLQLEAMKGIHVDYIKQMSTHSLTEIMNTINNKVLIIINPAYQRVFKEDTLEFERQFAEMLKSKKTSLGTNFAYQRVWIANSLHNLSKIVETPNVIREKKHIFDKKPVILVAAGPSLSDELENLRYIKENKLAYIFAVGSANRSLINHGIYPDAITTYDPTFINYAVFEEIISQDIKEIPLIFGSSVNYKTVQLYPGPQLHMFINQDTISPFYLGKDIEQNGEILLDAPSIAVVTLELLYKLGADPIILVGQNFAYRNEEYFAKGIEYDFRPSTVTKEEKEGIIMVESVDGDEVATGLSHIYAKNQMESYLNLISQQRQVWNTTKGGAKIQGAMFKTLESITKESLLTPIVDTDWHLGPTTEYDWNYVEGQAQLMEDEHDKLALIIDDIVKMLLRISTYIDHRQITKLDRMFLKFDNRMTEMLNNMYYRVFLRPMTRTMFETTEKLAPEIRKVTNAYEKGRLVLESMGNFIYETRKLYMDMMPLYMNLNKIVNMTVEEEKAKSSAAATAEVTNEQPTSNLSKG